jgi:rSAM/selenodomain-associated transferase 1
VKTRLAGDIGAVAAAELYAAFAADLTDRFRTMGGRRVLAYAPADADGREYAQSLAAGDYDVWPQPSAELGSRMQAFFADAFGAGGSRVVLIGSDSPTLPVSHVEQAFKLLAVHDCVLAPATDGGYCLIGLSRRLEAVFEGVPWSSSAVLRQTIERLTQAGATLSLLPPWYDVDTLRDLHVLAGHLAAMDRAGQPTNLERTRAVLRRLLP